MYIYTVATYIITCAIHAKSSCHPCQISAIVLANAYMESVFDQRYSCPGKNSDTGYTKFISLVNRL